jgi:hypothetical protein
MKLLLAVFLVSVLSCTPKPDPNDPIIPEKTDEQDCIERCAPVSCSDPEEDGFFECDWEAWSKREEVEE